MQNAKLRTMTRQTYVKSTLMNKITNTWQRDEQVSAGRTETEGQGRTLWRRRNNDNSVVTR